MNTTLRYRNEYENYAPFQVYYHKSVKYRLSHERFVVPWQMEESKKEKSKSK
ncbi:hypothetical protein [Mariniphaga sediminis]|uniref:hypothetical protein n=1 Tax=Mariniphaga sediminis TaxID=1628158 RepID=UPI0015597B66|nr:hypothetical protein [Mariniphaga sediminis]